MKPHRRRITIPIEGLSEPTIDWCRSGYHVDLSGRKVFVYERGTGPVVLLVHGFPTSCYDWRGVIDCLSLNGRRVAFDFLGFGLSDKPEDYSYSLFQQADMIESLLGELNIKAAHVVSHDMGTSVHCELLARQNAGRLGFEIKSSSLLNGSMLQWMANITPLQQMLSANQQLDEAIEICRGDLASIYIPALRAIMQKPEALSDEDAVVMNELMAYQNGQQRIPAIAGYMRERYVHRDRWLGGLEKTAAPLQFIWADGDPIANAAMGRQLNQRYPQARFTELHGVGHFLLMEDPVAVSREIQALIAPGSAKETCDSPNHESYPAPEADQPADADSALETPSDETADGIADQPASTKRSPDAGSRDVAARASLPDRD